MIKKTLSYQWLITSNVTRGFTHSSNHTINIYVSSSCVPGPRLGTEVNNHFLVMDGAKGHLGWSERAVLRRGHDQLCSRYSLLCNKPPQNLVVQTMTAIIFSWIYNLGRAWWGQSVSALPSISWGSLEGRDWTHLKACSFTCLVVDAGCCQGSHLGLSTETPACELSMQLLVFFTVWWPGFKSGPPKGELGWSCIIFFDLVLAFTQSQFYSILFTRSKLLRPVHI